LSECHSSGILNAEYNNPQIWSVNLNSNLDRTRLGVEIIAYRIQWFSGGWSDWYVKGINDIDWVTNGNSQRRVWSCFEDNTHDYIYCK